MSLQYPTTSFGQTYSPPTNPFGMPNQTNMRPHGPTAIHPHMMPPNSASSGGINVGPSPAFGSGPTSSSGGNNMSASPTMQPPSNMGNGGGVTIMPPSFLGGQATHTGTEPNRTPQSPMTPLSPITPQSPMTPLSPTMPQSPMTPLLPNRIPQSPMTPLSPITPQSPMTPLSPRPTLRGTY